MIHVASHEFFSLSNSMFLKKWSRTVFPTWSVTSPKLGEIGASDIAIDDDDDVSERSNDIVELQLTKINE